MKASLLTFYDPSVSKSPVDLLPVLELQARWPALSLQFELPAPTDSQLPFDVHLTEDFNLLLGTCRSNVTLVGHVKDCAILSLEFHSGNYLQRKYPNLRLTQRIQIRFKREHKQLWMDESFTTLDVWVGIALLGAMGKGLRISTETQKLERLIDRGTLIVWNVEN